MLAASSCYSKLDWAADHRVLSCAVYVYAGLLPKSFEDCQIFFCTCKKEAGRVVCAECGPRFELKIYQIRLGTLEQQHAENEWVLRALHAQRKEGQAGRGGGGALRAVGIRQQGLICTHSYPALPRLCPSRTAYKRNSENIM